MSNIYSLVDDEEWKPIWGYPGYQISSHGRCVSHWKIVGRGTGVPTSSKLDPSYTRFVGSPESKNTKKKRGYIQVHLGRDKSLQESHPISYYNKLKEGRPNKAGMFVAKFPMHKLVMWHFNWIDDNPEQIGITTDEWLSMPERAKEIIRQSLEINHIDHDPTNNKLSNLEYVTKVENSQAYNDSDKHKEYMQWVDETGGHQPRKLSKVT